MAGGLATKEGQDRQEIANLREGLSLAQLLVCQMVAEFRKPAEIAGACADAIESKEITLGWIDHISSPARRPAKYSPLINLLRRHYNEAAGNIAGRSAGWRDDLRTKAAIEAYKAYKFTEMRELLNDLEKRPAILPPTPTAGQNILVMGDMVTEV